MSFVRKIPCPIMKKTGGNRGLIQLGNGCEKHLIFGMQLLAPLVLSVFVFSAPMALASFSSFSRFLVDRE